MIDILKYWWRVTTRSYSDSAHFFGANSRKATWTFFITFMAAAGFYYFEGQQKAAEKLEWYFLLLIAFWSFFVVVFIVTFLRTPYLMETEAAADLTKRLADETARADSLSMQIEERDRVKPVPNLQQRELIRLRNEFRRLLIEMKDGNPKAVGAFDMIDREAHQYIERQVPGFLRYGTKFPVNTTMHVSAVVKHSDFAHFVEMCEDRISIMNTILGPDFDD